MNFPEAMAALDARTNYETSGRLVAPTLERMRALMDLLANPEKSLQAIHVTGTNGKTTCARAAAAVLRAAGLRVGTYTSPHLVSATERIAFDGRPIPPGQFAATLEYLEPFLAVCDERAGRVTWFEAITALAFAWFADRAVDAAVVEVGMGGTWDATNVVDAAVAAVTGVALDHPVLGSTPAEIAAEKAGIVKDGAVVLVAEGDPAVLAVIENRCRERGAELRTGDAAGRITERLLAIGGQRLEIRIGERTYSDLLLPLHGRALAADAVLGAAGAIAFLGDRDLSDEVMAEAFESISSPGRVEVAARSPLVVLDGAHNPNAAAALAEAMRVSFRWERLILVAAMLADKDAEGVLTAVAPLADEAIVAPVASPRGAPPERLRDALAPFGLDATIAPSVADALRAARERASVADCVLVTGSLYTVGEAKQALTGEIR